MIVAIIQARLGSTRFPQKVLAELHGQSVLELYIRRVLPCKEIDKVIVATTTEPEDEKIAEVCAKVGVECFRGSEDDLLDRYYQCARRYSPEAVVRLTSDDAFVDHEVVDHGVRVWRETQADFVNNHFTATYPEGLDTEIYSFAALERSWREAKLKSEREHVFPYIENHQDEFKVAVFTQETDRSDLRWTVDYPCDLDMVKQVYAHLYEKNPVFLQQEILDLLDAHPEIVALNSHIKRKEGVNKTKANDSIVRN